MHPIFEILMIFLCAAGLVILGWYLFGRLAAPVGEKAGGPVYAVVPAAGSGENLERNLRGLHWLEDGGWARMTIVIADGGLNEQGRSAAAALLTRVPEAVICPADRLGELVTARLEGEGRAD